MYKTHGVCFNMCVTLCEKAFVFLYVCLFTQYKYYVNNININSQTPYNIKFLPVKICFVRKFSG